MVRSCWWRRNWSRSAKHWYLIVVDESGGGRQDMDVVAAGHVTRWDELVVKCTAMRMRCDDASTLRD